MHGLTPSAVIALVIDLALVAVARSIGHGFDGSHVGVGRGGKVLEEGSGGPQATQLADVALLDPHLLHQSVERLQRTERSGGGRGPGFAVRKRRWSFANDDGSDDLDSWDLHADDQMGPDSWRRDARRHQFGDGGCTAATAGVSMAVFDSETHSAALEEGRAGRVHVYLSQPAEVLATNALTSAHAASSAASSKAAPVPVHEAIPPSTPLDTPLRPAALYGGDGAAAHAAAAAAVDTMAVEARELPLQTPVAEPEGLQVKEPIRAEAIHGATEAVWGAAAEEVEAAVEKVEAAAEEVEAAVDVAEAAAEAAAEVAERHTTSTILREVASLKQQARSAARTEEWGEAFEAYREACELLKACVLTKVEESSGGEGGEQVDEEATERRRAMATQVQACRLNGALCALELEKWVEAISLCTEVLKANPRCAKAHYRRGLALEAEGKLEAAMWDLERAAALQPSRTLFTSAVSAIRKRADSRPPLGDGSSGGLDSFMSQVIGGVGAGSRGGPTADGGPNMGSLLGGLGGDCGPDVLLGLLSGMGGAPGDEGSSLTGDNDLSPLEAMLKSPLLRQSGIGGKGSAQAMGMLAKVLALRRQMKRVWRHLKPWLPLLFWLALLLPLILTFKQRVRVRVHMCMPDDSHSIYRPYRSLPITHQLPLTAIACHLS